MTRSILYADDTLILEVDVRIVQQFMREIGIEGAKYGLALNTAKLEILVLNVVEDVVDDAGKVIKKKD